MKYLLILFCIIVTGCSTYKVEHIGVVENITLTARHHSNYRLLVWDGNKYTTVYTNRLYNIGETIKY